MANPKTLSEWAPIVGIVAAWVLLMVWLRRAQNMRAALGGKTGELKRRRGLAFAWSMIGVGVFMVVMMAASWRNVPSGNEPVVAWIVIIGALCALFGAYRLYRLGK